jgi:acyl-CoA synthetase (AMP-forming)/AMP-acid ligase II
MINRPVIALDPALAEHVIPHRAEYEANGAWPDERFGSCVAEHCAKTPDAEAVVDRKGLRRITFAELDRLSNQFANWLVDNDIEQGDVISVQLPNSLEATVIAVGANKAGVIINPMMTVYRGKEIRHILKKTQARAIFIPGVYRGFDHPELMSELQQELEHNFKVVQIDIPDDDASGLTDWIDSLQNWSDKPCGRTPSASDVSVILFTSGTEAAPKAVMHTDQTLNSNYRSIWQSFEMGENEIIWTPSPVGHSSGFNYGIRFALLHGAKVVLQDRWTPEEAVALVQRESPTFTLAATIFLTDLLKVAESRPVNMSSLRIFACGGAPIPAAVVNAAADQGISVLRLYGQTECMIATSNFPSSPLQKRIDTDGGALQGYRIEIRDDDGNVLPPNTEGELCVIGPGMSIGYYDSPEQTLTKFKDGWVRTADVAIMDDDGYVTIVGRKSEIIIRGGMNITPREVEEAIEPISGVAAVTVIGLPHERLGEYCCACVIAEPGSKPELEQICSELKKFGVATYKLPERLEIVDSFPTTASGKIQRHKLVEMFNK